MAQQPNITLQNNFIGGLKTEYTALNFPENACTDMDNCVISLIGDISTRPGMAFESGGVFNPAGQGGAISGYKWNNVGGDGQTQIVVEQNGIGLLFYLSSAATSGISPHLLTTNFVLTQFTAAGNTQDITQFECQFSDGNGFLFVFHPCLEPFFCSYDPSTQIITPKVINLQIRDFAGIPEPGVPVNLRQTFETTEHLYNLQNQGWTAGTPWTATSTTTNTVNTGTQTFTIATGLTITSGQNIQVYATGPYLWLGKYTYQANHLLAMTGTVTSYNSSTGQIVLNIYTTNAAIPTGNVFSNWNISPTNSGYINTFATAEGVFPSNADVWWYFKDSTGVFNPATTAANVSLGSGQAPQGHFILNAFNQQRSLVSGVAPLTDVVTVNRPKTGTWFQGRVWYSGVDASQQATGDEPYFTWTENIYFSQIINSPTNTVQFGYCYQVNDPTDENTFDILATDGGVIQIQGCGSIYKLFPIQNGLFVFAANGIWFITGNQGLGFTANDYTISKISSIQSISGSSFVNLQGWPAFWNEEGIYLVSSSKENSPYGFGGFAVENLCLGTILSFYNNIPLISKKYAKGDYDPISYVLTWIYRSVAEPAIQNRYQMDSALNLNTVNRAFYPFSFVRTGPSFPIISDIRYVAGPGGSISPPPTFKFFSFNNNTCTFSELVDDQRYTDFFGYEGGIGFAYDSYFVTGYQLHGKGITRWQPTYVNVYSNGGQLTAYTIQGIWDYSASPSSKQSVAATVINGIEDNWKFVVRRHKVRGHGYVLQLRIEALGGGAPMDIMGWSVYEAINRGP